MSCWRRIVSLALTSALFAAVAANAAPNPQAAVETPVPLPTDDKIVSFAYSADAVYTLLTEVGYGTHIQLETGEGITEKPALGDTIQWRVSGGPTNLYVKPTRPDLATTMTVVTNKRTYEFQLISSVAGGKFYQKVFFYYPEEEQAIQLRAKEDAQVFVAEKHRLADQAITAPDDPAAFHYGYTVTGDALFRPIQVLDNGRKTFIQMPVIQDQPAVFLEDEDGKLQLVDSHLRDDNYIVVDRVANRLALKLGDQKVEIVSDRVPKHWWSTLGSSARQQR